MTVPSTDSERAPALDAPPPVGASRPLPRRVPALPVRQRNRVSIETLEATFAGLQQVDENARPAAPAAPPADLWPPVTGSQPHVTA